MEKVERVGDRVRHSCLNEAECELQTLGVDEDRAIETMSRSKILTFGAPRHFALGHWCAGKCSATSFLTRNKKSPDCSICHFFWCKYSPCGRC